MARHSFAFFHAAGCCGRTHGTNNPVGFGAVAHRASLCIVSLDCALEAFTLNPLVQSGRNGKRVLDELLVAHEKYLPQFKMKIKELKEQGIETDDPVVKELLNKNL